MIDNVDPNYELIIKGREDCIRATKVNDLLSALWEYDQWLRNEVKHNGKDYQPVLEKFYSLLDEHGVNFEQMKYK